MLLLLLDDSVARLLRCSSLVLLVPTASSSELFLVVASFFSTSWLYLDLTLKILSHLLVWTLVHNVLEEHCLVLGGRGGS